MQKSILLKKLIKEGKQESKRKRIRKEKEMIIWYKLTKNNSSTNEKKINIFNNIYLQIIIRTNVII